VTEKTDFVGAPVARFPIWACHLVELEVCDGLGEEAAENLRTKGRITHASGSAVKRRREERAVSRKAKKDPTLAQTARMGRPPLIR
jgi:ribosome assembly protein YihI (activator of Der GTPase)